MSDECNTQCGKRIIDSIVLRVIALLCGSIAILLNITIIVSYIKNIKRGASLQSVRNELFIMVIGCGDLLTGLYLISLVGVDFYYSDKYCSQQTKWLTSSYCSAIGVTGTIASQFSLFSMTILSLYRAIGISRSFEGPSGEISTKGYISVAIVLFLVVFVSFMIAFLPLIPYLEDYFVNGLSYTDKNRLFIGLVDKDLHFKILEEYFGRLKKVTLKWSTIRTLTSDMFSKDYGGINSTSVGFYGNTGVCMFKFFVDPTDPQKYYVWFIIALNFLCFLTIAICYLVINTISLNTSRDIAKTNKTVKKRNQRLQRKVSIIIGTDFCCWVPFIVVCILHSAQVINATSWYVIFSIAVLPLNSVINPLLYNDTIISTVVSWCNWIMAVPMSMIVTKWRAIINWFYIKANLNQEIPETEEIPMTIMNPGARLGPTPKPDIVTTTRLTNSMTRLSDKNRSQVREPIKRSVSI